MSTCSPVIRPLMNNTTRRSALTTRSILQLILGFRFNPSITLATRGSRGAGFVKHVCQARLLKHDSRRNPIGFPSLPGVCFTEECQRWRFVAMCDANSIMVLNLAACHQIRERLNEQTFDGPLQRAGAISEIDALGQQELPGAGRHIYKEWLTGGSSLDALLHEVELN